jgi:2-iminoacetate synthase
MATAGGSLEWSRDRVEETVAHILEPARVAELLETARRVGPSEIQDIIYEAKTASGLTPLQAAALLQVESPELRAEVMATAHAVHTTTHERRIGIVTPVCPTNRCVNDCLYCPLRSSNSRLKRTASSARDLQREVMALLDEGYRHITLVFGEDRSGIHYIRDMIWTAYGTRSGLRQLQRVDVNINPLRMSELRDLREVPRLGAFHVFQETYHPQTYAALHPRGPKADYAWRLTCHDRAYESGLGEVGLGVLLGAYDHRFDVVALLQHARYLADTYGHGPHAITYPRMIPAPAAPASRNTDYAVSDEEFCYLVAVTRLADPCVDIILATPAPRDVRVALYGLGASQVSVGSQSYPGVYTSDGDPQAAGALKIGRPRALEELVYRMAEAGFVANFCAACYGNRPPVNAQPDTFRHPCVFDRCGPNSLLALKEYLLDHASSDTQAICERVIQRELALLPEQLRGLTFELMEEVEAALPTRSSPVGATGRSPAMLAGWRQGRTGERHGRPAGRPYGGTERREFLPHERQIQPSAG